jgi:hypothetical protein
VEFIARNKSFSEDVAPKDIVKRVKAKITELLKELQP